MFGWEEARFVESGDASDPENIEKLKSKRYQDRLRGPRAPRSSSFRKPLDPPTPDASSPHYTSRGQQLWQVVREHLRSGSFHHLSDRPAVSSSPPPSYLDVARSVDDDRTLGVVSFECEIGDILEQHFNPGIEVLLNQVVIVRSSRLNSRGKLKYDYRAMTCHEYMMARWGILAEAVLLRVYQAIMRGKHYHVKNDCNLNKEFFETELLPATNKGTRFESEGRIEVLFSVQYDEQHRELSLDAASETSRTSWSRLLQIVDFLCRAIRGSTDGKGDTVSGSFVEKTTGQARNCRSHRLSRSLVREHTRDRTSCWWQLFRDSTILESEPLPMSSNDRNNGQGLELSFSLMLALAATTNVLPVDRGVLFFGYRTVIIPKRICEEHDYVQYHLEVAVTGQIDPIAKAEGRVAPIANPAKLLEMRCFLGWTAFAQVLLGSKELSFDIKRSCTKQIQKSVQLKEFSIGLQALYSAVGQVGLTTEATFGFTSHRLMYSPSADYEAMLFRAAKQIALIIDVEAKRSWLVPKLSLLLHLAHVYVFSHNIQTSGLPFVDAHDSPQQILDVLSGQFNNAIFGSGPSARRLGPLLTDLNRDLSMPLDEKLKAKTKSLVGLELMDIIDRPDRGTYPRKATARKQWSSLGNLVDVTVVCSSIGNVIKSSPSHRCTNEKCNTLPTGRDYLAALTSCLGRLTEETKNDINSLRLAPGVELTDGKALLITGSPFGTCQHSSGATGSCWTRPAMFQSVQEDRWLNKLRKSKSCMASLTLPEKGAVVFGKRLKELTSDQPMITVTSGQAQVA